MVRPAREGQVDIDTLLADLARYESLIDTRTPAEYALDHLPGAVNLPVLTDAERIDVGTRYRQVSAFEAKKHGAALVARNIADHLEKALIGHPPGWRPLVYCWRGGKRSAAMVGVLRAIGWRADQLEGGYKAYRRRVVNDLDLLPGRFAFKVIAGRTGSGKSRLLRALQSAGAQVLDLEGLGKHRGSVLGELPEAPQPAQKRFESLIWAALRGFSPAAPVWVEAESKRVGKLRVPDALIAAMRAGECHLVEADDCLRVELLGEEYSHFVQDAHLLREKLSHLSAVLPTTLLARWEELAAVGHWREVVQEMLKQHYDPLYARSMDRNYVRLPEAAVVTLRGIGEADFARAAREIMQRQGKPTSAG
jgi:tRNA 2-selenouridine synthase